MELVLGGIRMAKAKAKAEKLETITLKSDMAYQLIFSKHIQSKAEVRADILGDYDSPAVKLFRDQ